MNKLAYAISFAEQGDLKPMLDIYEKTPLVFSGCPKANTITTFYRRQQMGISEFTNFCKLGKLPDFGQYVKIEKWYLSTKYIKNYTNNINIFNCGMFLDVIFEKEIDVKDRLVKVEDSIITVEQEVTPYHVIFAGNGFRSLKREQFLAFYEFAKEREENGTKTSEGS